MNGMQSLESLDLNYESPVHQEIDPQISANALATILDRYTMFARDSKPFGGQFDQQAISIDGFEESRSQRTVNVDRAADHQLRQFVYGNLRHVASIA